MNIKDAVLCYVESGCAYFTTQELSKQWGDDWGDYAYEHNAGTPYEFSEYDQAQGVPRWRIVKVMTDRARYETPRDQYENSPFSVEYINQGKIPWIAFSEHSYEHGKTPAPVFAGTTLANFLECMSEAQVDVFLSQADWSELTEELRSDL